jgi:hypothetical protein
LQYLHPLRNADLHGQERQTGQVPQNLPQNTRNEPLIGSEAHHNDNGAIRRAQGTATTSNRQVDYSTQVPSNSSNNNNPSADRAQQLAADEELARRLQRQEVLEARREEHEQEEGPVPFRYNLGFFNPSTRSGMRDSQSFDHDDIEEDYEVLPYSRSEMYETDDPEDIIRNIFPPIRTIVPQESHPVNQFLRNLLLSARTGQDLHNLPRQRIVYPQQFFQLQGFDSVPPHLREMLQGDSDTSYERLLELSEALQPVSRGADPERIESLPTRQFHEKNSNQDPSQKAEESSSSTTCNICLDDFKEKEVVTTLPQCLHSFHKTCISKWLAINKICPVCRTDISEAQHA